MIEIYKKMPFLKDFCDNGGARTRDPWLIRPVL